MILFITISIALAASAQGAPASQTDPISGNANSEKNAPVYGTTRYGKPTSPWANRSPPSYYHQPLYYQSYPEDIFYRPEPIIHYPYYPVARQYSSNLYPYYYPERMPPYDFYGDAAYDSLEDISDVNQRLPVRSDALPVGQETWYENEPATRWQDNYDDVNEAFVQKLIMREAYNNAWNNKNIDLAPEPLPQDHLSDYGEYYGERDTRDFEDEDVRELKALAGKPLYHVPKTSVYNKVKNDKVRQFNKWQQETTTETPYKPEDHYYDEEYPSDEGWINWGNKRSPKQNVQKLKQMNKTPKPQYATTTAIPTATKAPEIPKFSENGGQKEVVLPRPATPARHPFPESVMKSLAAQRKRSPSVYDQIKQLMTLEDEQYAHAQANNANKARVQKRFVSSEADLVGELKGLKRRSTS